MKAAVLFLGMVAVAAQKSPPQDKRVWKLLTELESADYRVRQAAHRELVRLGEDVVPTLKLALTQPISLEKRRRIEQILALYRPPEFVAHFNGWHWVYSTIAHAQTFEATGSTVKSLQLRVAQLSADRPTAPLEVEIRDSKLQSIYLKGTIDPDVLKREFAWQAVALKHISPLEKGQTYVLVFHSQDSTNKGPWAINAIYEDVYPFGRHWYNHHEDFFFCIDYADGMPLRVGPRSDDTPARTPINSGATGGGVGNGGPLQLQTFGRLPDGKLRPPLKKKQ